MFFDLTLWAANIRAGCFLSFEKVSKGYRIKESILIFDPICKEGPIGYQILKKSETFGLKQCFSYPPGVGGCRWIIGIWEKKCLDYWYLREQKSVFGPAEGRKFWGFWAQKP